jgi:hypothetical protein
MEVSTKMDRLKDFMSESETQQLNSKITEYISQNSNSNYADIDTLFLYPKIRQYGMKVEIKKRVMQVIVIEKKVYRFAHQIKQILLNQIEKKIKEKDENFSLSTNMEKALKYLKQRNIIKEIDHYSVWIDNMVYHWGSDYKDWKIYGVEETNREIVNEWDNDIEYPNVYFTLRTKEEIEEFSNLYKKIKFDLNNNNSYHFRSAMLKFLHIDNYY